MKSRLGLALVAANLLLAGLLLSLWQEGGTPRSVQWQPPRPMAPDLGTTPTDARLAADADVSRFMVILDRPIFSPSRKPPPPPKAASRVPDPMDNVQLFGTFSSPEGGGVLLRVDGKSRRLRASEVLGEWTLREVRPREAVFVRGGESRVVPMLVARGVAARAPALPPAVAAPAPLQPPPPAAAAAAAADPPVVGAKPGVPSAKTPAPAPASSPFVIGGSR